MKHTKEPWVTEDEFIDSVEGYAVARCRWDNGDQGEEDAKRIVACVNACKGLTNEVLEAGIVKDGIVSLSTSIELKSETYCGERIWEDSDGK